MLLCCEVELLCKSSQGLWSKQRGSREGVGSGVKNGMQGSGSFFSGLWDLDLGPASTLQVSPSAGWVCDSGAKRQLTIVSLSGCEPLTKHQRHM